MKLRKKLGFFIVTALLGVVIVDVLSAYVLFFYQHAFFVKNIWGPANERSVVYSDGFTPTLSIVKTMIDRIEDNLQARKKALQPRESQFKVLFMRDAELGWKAAPGNHEFLMRPQEKFQEWPAVHHWHVRILPDGSRATSRDSVVCNHKILILGDSWTFGWALDDELTMARHLQSEYYNRFCVHLLAHGGYGHLQALRNFRKRQSQIGKGDILIVGYAQWLLPRNLPSPSVVRSLADGLKKYADGPDKPLSHPRVRGDGEGGRLFVDSIPLDCEMVGEYCEKAEPSLDELFAVTNKIFDEMINHTEAKILVLLLDGPEDKVIGHLKSRGITIVDGRPPDGIFAKDTMNPYDAHPGPVSNLYWFTQLRKEIDTSFAITSQASGQQEDRNN